MDSFNPYSLLNFKFLLFYCSLFTFIGHKLKDCNNHLGTYKAGIQNSTGAFMIIMAYLQTLVNNLPVWQRSCESKLHPLSSRLSSA